jgi:hypothetical protein
MAQNDDTTVENVDWPSLDEVYTEVKDRISSQNDRNKTIDGKANFGLAAATLLTAGVTGLSKVVGDVATKSNVGQRDFILFHAHLGTVADWITVASLAVYGMAAISAYMAYHLRAFRESPKPQRLVEHYVNQDPRITKATITRELAKDYAFNEDVIDEKVKWTNRTMVFLIVETALLLLIALIQVIWL